MAEILKAKVETEVPGTGYRVFTGSTLLRDAALRAMADPFVYRQRDVPPDEPGAVEWADALRDGPDVDVGSLSLEDQAVVLVPLMNALRLRVPAVGPLDPSLFAGAREAMLRADPGVAMLAIRNSAAWEACNRPSGQGWEASDGLSLFSRLISVDDGWFQVFLRIRRAMGEAKA